MFSTAPIVTPVQTCLNIISRLRKNMVCHDIFLQGRSDRGSIKKEGATDKCQKRKARPTNFERGRYDRPFSKGEGTTDHFLKGKVRPTLFKRGRNDPGDD